MGERSDAKPGAGRAMGPFVALTAAYLGLNSVLNLSNKYALVSFLRGGGGGERRRGRPTAGARAL